jgi:hypothetical protein
MLTAILAGFVGAVVLGVLLLMPKALKTGFFSRSIVAGTHGILGAIGFTSYLFWLAHTSDAIPSIVRTAVVLTGLGLALGAASFVATRHKSKPPDLILLAHVVFAGMGALVIVGLILI